MAQPAGSPDEPSLSELEEQEELVWALLDQLRPLLDVLDALDADDVSGPASGSHAVRLEAMLRLLAAGVNRARRTLPAPLPRPPRDRAPLSAEEREQMAFVADALEQAPHECASAHLITSIDEGELRAAVERFRRADLFDRVADAVALLRNEMELARLRIDRHLASAQSVLRGDDDRWVKN